MAVEKDKAVLFVSNGYGEDSIALSILREIKSQAPDVHVYALPIVGNGGSYETEDCEILGPRTAMPSGGVIPGNFGNLKKDLSSGLIKLTFAQIGIIKKYSKLSFASVSIGDIYPAILLSLFAKNSRVMIATAKSNYVSPHNKFEEFIMKTFFKKVFVRDNPTAEHLRKNGVSNAVYVGNAMMDCLEPEGIDFKVNKENLFAVLPGSRKSAFIDMPVIADAISIIADKIEDSSFVAVVPKSIDLYELVKVCSDEWQFEEEKDDFCVGKMSNKKNKAVVKFYNRGMADLLRTCKLVIGQAGTANEQATGLGKPVVAFDSFSDDKMGWYRKRQKCLLGEAVSVVKKNPSEISDMVFKILNDSELYKKMAEEGKNRLGLPGGAQKMAKAILSLK